jgi:hypothetical protein
MEIIWSEEKTDTSSIVVSRYYDDAWQNDEIISTDSSLNILPTMAGNTSTNRLAVWSQITSTRSNLQFSKKQNDQWSVPSVIETPTANNLAPAITCDHHGRYWLFWTGNNGDDDDVYFSVFTEGKWREPRMVNENNSIADILPETWTDADGKIWVRWQRLEENGYSTITKFFESDSDLNEIVSAEYSEASSLQSSRTFDLQELPSRIKSRSRIGIFTFGQNKSEFIDGNISQ